MFHPKSQCLLAAPWCCLPLCLHHFLLAGCPAASGQAFNPPKMFSTFNTMCCVVKPANNFKRPPKFHHQTKPQKWHLNQEVQVDVEDRQHMSEFIWRTDYQSRNLASTGCLEPPSQHNFVPCWKKKGGRNSSDVDLLESCRKTEVVGAFSLSLCTGKRAIVLKVCCLVMTLNWDGH